ncbi:cellulose-binding protein [Xylariaceae sp. FL0662B]|nr:cellulose-binding protein [Xylariaceae sp. FL0662B]
MKISQILTAATCLTGTALAQTRLKIMPLGDSITALTCWRARLWDLLNANNVTDKIQFVGSKIDNADRCQAADPNWNKRHEGHPGFLAIDIANDHHLEGWLNTTQPDIVMFMLGTDDIAQGKQEDYILLAYTDMVTQMRASNPNMTIIVDTIVPLLVNDEAVQNLNAAIPSWASDQNQTESPIYVNDIYPFPNTALRDGVHPNDAGDDIIANTLSPLLTWIVNSNTTANSTDTE